MSAPGSSHHFLLQYSTVRGVHSTTGNYLEYSCLSERGIIFWWFPPTNRSFACPQCHYCIAIVNGEFWCTDARFKCKRGKSFDKLVPRNEDEQSFTGKSANITRVLQCQILRHVSHPAGFSIIMKMHFRIFHVYWLERENIDQTRELLELMATALLLKRLVWPWW